MVLDRLGHASTYAALSPGLTRALRHLATTDWGAMAEGRHPIEDDRLFAIVSDYDTREAGAVPWEAHRRYIDVQYVHAGIELIGYAPLAALTRGDYDADRDLVVAEGTGGFVALEAGSFAILWPQDAHRPGIAVGAPRRVRKIVLKVAVDWQPEAATSALPVSL